MITVDAGCRTNKKLKYRTLRFSGEFSKWLNPLVRLNPEFFERFLKMLPLKPNIVYVLQK